MEDAEFWSLVGQFDEFFARTLRSPPQPSLSGEHSPLRVQNVVAGANFGPLAGQHLFTDVPVVTRINFTGDVFRWLLKPGHPCSSAARVKCLLSFGTGARQVSGAPSPIQALAALHLCRIIENSLGFVTRFDAYKVDNVVASGELPFTINLPALHVDDERGVAWQPDKFPGAVCYLPQERVVVLLFDSVKRNKMICVGMQTPSQIPIVEEHVVTLSLPFQIDDSQLATPATGMANKSVQRCLQTRVAGDGTTRGGGGSAGDKGDLVVRNPATLGRKIRSKINELESQQGGGGRLSLELIKRHCELDTPAGKRRQQEAAAAANSIDEMVRRYVPVSNTAATSVPPPSSER